ncbi:MAG: efflux RND transporter periplasmic adaptor subunit [Lachnospiraceae bacterium]|nr:efflux RND transporter periplasmic adaptor subunit [Lachnospiraceae bacterium]MBQ3163329.1 efflux RND transporter periplasmic adaptor subunit [Lachnospiraceae bacterium]
MKKKQMIKITGIVVVIIAIAGTTAFAGTSSIKVTTQTIGSAGITQNVEAEGHIESEQEKVYYAGVSAPIASFSLENGDMVQTGEQLVSYDTEDLDRSVIQADIQAKALAAGYAGSVQQSKELKQAYQDAQTLDVTYQDASVAMQQQLGDMQLNIEVVADSVEDQTKEINLKIAQLKAEITQKNAIASNDELSVDDRNDYLQQAAWMEVEVAKLQKKLLTLEETGATPIENRYFKEAEIFLGEVAAQRSMLQQEMLSTKHAGMNTSQLEQMAQNVALAQQTLSWNEAEAEKASGGVVAEFSGVVSEVGIEEGTYVTEGTRLFTIKDHKNLRAVVEVTSHEMSQIVKGQQASIEVGGQLYEGEVTKIRMETVTDAQNKAKLQVEVHINNPDERIYLGTDADVTIQTGKSESAVLIPNNALYADDGGDYCYLLENGVITKRYLMCGLSGDAMTEVVEGLAEGEKVIIDAMTDEKVGKSAQEK